MLALQADSLEQQDLGSRLSLLLHFTFIKKPSRRKSLVVVPVLVHPLRNESACVGEVWRIRRGLIDRGVMNQKKMQTNPSLIFTINFLAIQN